MTTVDELARARALLDTRRWDDAVGALRVVLARTPEDPEPHRLMAQALLGMRQPAQAVLAAEHALALDPTSTWSRRLRALALTNAGRHAEAVAEGRVLVSLVPDEWRAWWVLSVACRGLGGGLNVDEAVRAARRAVTLGPEHGDTHNALGSALLAQGNADGADASFRRALALDPSDAYALNGLGQVALRRRDSVTAAEGFRRALQANPQEQAARHNLRVVLQQILRPVTIVILLCAIVGHTATGGSSYRPGLRALAAICAAVATSVLVGSAYTTFRRLDPSLRRFYLRLVREDRRLAWGAAAHGVAIVALWLVVVLPAAAASAVGLVAFLAAVAGRLLVFPLRRAFVRRR